jgi:GNAT superfamily N-acetyltransferase
MESAFENLIDWGLPICFCSVDVCVSKIVAELCKKHGKLLDVDACEFMSMDNADALKLQIVYGFRPEIIPYIGFLHPGNCEFYFFRNSDPVLEIKELDPKDAELVTKRWKFSGSGTLELMEAMIRHTGSAGVYVNQTLVSWVVLFAMGSINALYTEDDHRKKGYGRLTMQKACQIAGLKGLVPNVQIEVGNTPSTHLMESVGFTYSHDVEWVIYKNL